MSSEHATSCGSRSLLTQPSTWSGTIRVFEPGVIDTTIDMQAASIDYGAGTGSKTWITQVRVCGFTGCFYVPTVNGVSFTLDDRI